ncbi:MAG TPA: alpha/beta hydrolase [Planctomycetota bacterium]|nr:alpha/beta hydrolase [Planctomycetota bacterium]
MTPVETPLPAHRAAGRGPAILLLHAFPFSKEMWTAQLDDLARDHLVVAPDFPGFGGTPPLLENETTVARYAESAESVASSIAPGADWVVAGLSMGGYVAFEVIRRARLRLRGLVLADTRAEADTPAVRASRVALASQVKTRGAAAVVEAQIDKMITAQCPPDVRRRVEGWMGSAGREGLLGAIHALLERPDSTPTLSRIDVPTLAIGGEEDPITPTADMERMTAAIRGARLARVPSTAHLSNVESPARFLAELRVFLASFERPTS